MAQSEPSRTSRRPARGAVVVLAAILAVPFLAACGGGSGRLTLNWYINPDNGGQVELAQKCSDASNGAYTIKTSLLPNDATQQRQQLVQRLAAKDSSIDLMSLDPVFVAEFAEAGFLADIPSDKEDQFTDDIVPSAVQAATWHDELVAVPFWANTQLLWYRKSVAQAAGLDMTQPVTWDQVIQAAQSQGRTLGVQADRYEGYSVWINALISGAGGKIVGNPGAKAEDIELGLDSDAGRDAVRIIQKVSQTRVGGPALSTSQETQALNLFESDNTSGFLVNWPYTWADIGSKNIPFVSDIAWTQYPQTVVGRNSAPPFGGIEIGLGRFSKHLDQALAAVSCITSPESQIQYMLKSGNPAAVRSAYDDPQVREQYPMADTIRASLEAAAPRPQTQYYGDLSAALQRGFSPPSSLSDSTLRSTTTLIRDVLKGDKLL